MEPNDETRGQLDTIGIAEDLKLQICRLVDSLARKDEENAESDFVHYLLRARDLVERKRAMEGSKTDTRDLIGELLFNRLRRCMRSFLQTNDSREEIRVAEWVMGTLFSLSAMNDFAQAFDQALIQKGNNRDFNFAGRTDFISVEEVLQMLSAGKHLGCLSLEKADNRLDIYLKDGRVSFLDPHHMIRRVLPTNDMMRYREIPEAAVADAERERVSKGTPLLIALHEKSCFRAEEMRDLMRFFGKEVLYDFMRENEPYAFFYRRLDMLPQFAQIHDLRLGVTSILLEGSKRVDDWKQMLRVFPHPTQPLEPREDLFARMADVVLGPLEIKLLGLINGDSSPKTLMHSLGLPLHDIYQMLMRLAREGIITPPAGEDALMNVNLSVEESMQEAFAALDANDDTGGGPDAEAHNVLQKVLGTEEEVDGASDSGLGALDRVLGEGKKPK
jgi:Domain of unknown function (DUF4388)